MKNSNLSLSTPFTLVIYTACIPFILIFPFLVNNHAISFNIKDGLTLIATSIIIYISLPHKDHYGYTPAMNDTISGVASTLTIGETDELKENKSPAFYARFNGDRPPSYYWKVKILSAYDGNAWSQILLPSAPSSKTDKITGNIYNYSIATESNYNSGYIALENTILVDNNLLVNKNGIIYSSNEDIKNFYNATAVSVVQNIETNIKYYLSLPLNSHPKTKAIAQSLVDENDSTEIKVKKLLYYFKQQKFKYTLSPGKINDADKIDYFMTTSKKGFCQFYASAFAVMARSVGIPTRIIMGFQGGELSDDDNVLTVKYSDAHAWDEVYVDGHGWIRVDPTSYTDPLYNKHSLKEDLFSFIESKMLVFSSIKKQYMFNKQYIPFNVIISSLISCFLLFTSMYVIRKLKSWNAIESKMNKHGFNSLNYTHIPNRIWIHQYEYERYNLNKETPSFKLTYMTFNGCLLKKRNNKI